MGMFALFRLRFCAVSLVRILPHQFNDNVIHTNSPSYFESTACQVRGTSRLDLSSRAFHCTSMRAFISLRGRLHGRTGTASHLSHIGYSRLDVYKVYTRQRAAENFGSVKVHRSLSFASSYQVASAQLEAHRMN